MKSELLERIPGLAKDYLVPLLVATIPFAPSVYDRLTEPEVHFVYEHQNERSPVEEWNRLLDRMLSQVEHLENSALEKIPEPILKKIGQEIYQSLPAMLSGIGFHPMEKSKVWIANVSDRQLTNIKVHFHGCEGFDSYASAPDRLASNHNPQIKDLKGKDAVSLRYDKLIGSLGPETTLATMTYYGESTSHCRPTVEAEVDGKPAIGIKQSIHEYTSERKLNEQKSARRADLFFKLFLSLAVIYIFLKIRRIEKNRTTHH